MLRSLSKIIACVVGTFFISTNVLASDVGRCVDANIISGKLITDICWTCIFPIRVAGIPISTGGDSFVPDDAVSGMPICLCEDGLGVPHPGITTSMWEPYRLVEFQVTPGCSSVLNGIRFPFDTANMGTHGDGEGDGAEMMFTHYHFYAFPLLVIMDLFTGRNCNAGGYMDLDLMYLSEVDPTWNNDELAFFTNPEAALVANPVAVTACMADAISATAGEPIKEMFWCAGSWGGMYPLSGNVTGGDGTINGTSLMTARVLAALHRRGLAWGTVGRDAMCGGEIKVTLPKDQYKFTMVHPVPETERAHVMGEAVMRWGLGRKIPSVGEDPIYLIWRWNDCCN